MAHRVERLLALPRDDRQRLLEAWVLLWVVGLGLRVLPFRRIQAWAARCRKRRGGAIGEPQQTIDSVEQAVARAAYHMPRAVPCLHRAMAMQRMLGRQGVRAELSFGVCKAGDSLAAHAWLEVDGRPVGRDDGGEERFARLMGPDAGRPAGVRPGAGRPKG